MANPMTEEEIDREVALAMKNHSARRVASLNEPNADKPTDEPAYRKRLTENGPGLVDEMIEIMEE